MTNIQINDVIIWVSVFTFSGMVLMKFSGLYISGLLSSIIFWMFLFSFVLDKSRFSKNCEILVLFFVVKIFLTESICGRVSERGWCVIFRHPRSTSMVARASARAAFWAPDSNLNAARHMICGEALRGFAGGRMWKNQRDCWRGLPLCFWITCHVKYSHIMKLFRVFDGQ